MAPLPLPANVRALPLRLASFKSSVDATMPPTFTWAPCPNRMPFGLIKYTCPLALRWPSIWLPLVSKMRFTAIAPAVGCTKLTVSCAPMLKLFQFNARFWLDCVIVVVAPDVAMLPTPDASCPPAGAASAAPAALMASATDASFRLALLPRPRDFSATATHAFNTWLQMRRYM